MTVNPITRALRPNGRDLEFPMGTYPRGQRWDIVDANGQVVGMGVGDYGQLTTAIADPSGLQIKAIPLHGSPHPRSDDA